MELEPRILSAVEALETPFTFADVGGRFGLQHRWRHYAPPVEIVSFGADEVECKRSRAQLDPADAQVRFEAVAFGANARQAVLHITRDPACSSLYPPDADVIAAHPELEVAALVQRREIGLETLDGWCADRGIVIDAMKLDVQGAELDVLSGGRQQLERVVMLEVEVEFNPIYRGQPLFADVDRFLRDQGFVLWRLSHLAHYDRRGLGPAPPRADMQAFDSRIVTFAGGGGQLYWGDAWYVAADVLASPNPERKARAAMAALGFGFIDLAGLLAGPAVAEDRLGGPARSGAPAAAHATGSGELPGSDEPPSADRQRLTKADHENLDRAAALTRIDVSEHNQGGRAPTFASPVSQAPSAAQFAEPEYVRWAELLGFAQDGRLVVRGSTQTVFNRKVWEWAFILQAADTYGLLRPGVNAVGFGVGNEPVPAVLARHGVSVIATDQEAAASEDWETTGQWNSSGQLLSGVAGLLRPSIVADDRLAELVRVRRVDMNDIPDDLGPCDLTWSACALEHLGSPERGFEFVMRTARLLAPGGIAVHTTEMELTRRTTTADWGHLACYRPADLRWLASRVEAEGLEMRLNLHVGMDTPEDRWVSVVLSHGPELAAGELSHLKVAMFESVCTSFAILIHRPPADPA
jgi:FkbM family methyltransferase